MSSLKQNFIYNVAYQILLILLPLVTAPYISRTLGATSIGVYSYTNSIAYYFLMIAMLGISNHGNRSIAAARYDKEKLNRTFSSIYSLQIFTFSIAIIAYFLYIIFVGKQDRLIVALQMIYVVSGLFDISWLFFGLEKFKLTVMRNLLIKILTVICMFIFVHKPEDLWKYTLIMSVGTLTSQLYLWKYVKRYVKFVRVSLQEVLLNVKPVLVLFVPVLAYSIYKVMDKIMVGSMSTYEQVGFYQNAEKIVNIPMGIITALGTVMLPRMSHLVSLGNKEKSQQYIRLSFKFVTIVCSAIGFGLMGISYILAPVYLGQEFKESSSIIFMLSVTVFFIAWANIIRTQYLIPNHYDKVYLLSTIIGATLNLIANLVLIPQFQANGAAIGTIIAEGAVLIAQATAVRKELPVANYIISYSPILIIGTLMMIVVNCIGEKLGESIITLIIQIGSGGVFFCSLAAIYLFIKKDELWTVGIDIIKKQKTRKVHS